MLTVGPKSVPGTWCGARSDASKTQPGGPSNRCQALGVAPGRMLAKRGAQIGALHEWHCSPVVATCRHSHLSPDGGGLTRAAFHRLAADGYDLAADGYDLAADGYRSGVAT